MLTQDKLHSLLLSASRTLSPDLSKYFDELRSVGDPGIDPLVAETLRIGFSGVGKPAYNHLLDIADVLVESPELALNARTRVARQLRQYPEALQNYFDPVVAPPWLDEEKLARASRLWEQDKLGILAVLYALSLPSCYLIKNGIPTLYQSAHLREKRYIFQRIYETGVMLDAVLSPGGLRVIHDIDDSLDQHLEKAAEQLDPGSQWEWSGRLLIRTAAGERGVVSHHELNRELERLRQDRQSLRYVWGPGVVAAKKVRFLHAAMRFMLMNPEAVRPARDADVHGSLAESLQQARQPYDWQRLGVPVNQEDQAYTLLTFGYCIPQGLEKFGRRWNREEKEAFLHAWKVVGSLMGVREELLTDDWNFAEKLFHTIQHRQAAASEEAVALTETLVWFLSDYLPDHGHWNEGVAAGLIVFQLGEEQARGILGEKHWQASREPAVRAALGVALFLIRIYYRVRDPWLRIPAVGTLMRHTFGAAGEALIDSWRDVYQRRPFYIPVEDGKFKRIKGVHRAFLDRQRRWRRQLFNAVGAGVVCLMLAALGVFILPFLFWVGVGAVWMATLLVVGLAVAGMWGLRHRLKSLNQRRPTLQDDEVVVTASAPQRQPA